MSVHHRNTNPRRLFVPLARWALAAALATVLAGCGPSAPPRPNILLVTLDTTRYDRIGADGYALAHTPTLDRLAAQGTRFDNAIASAPITLPSHSSIMTGLYPPAHGVRDNGAYALSDDAVTLAERLKAAGYDTHAFVSALVLNRRYNLTQGFDTYDDDLWSEDDPKMFMIRSRPAPRTIDRVLAWYRAWADAPERKPFFTWVHLFDPHQPYRAPQWARAATTSIYDAEIALADRELGRFIDALEADHRLDDTLVIVTADHGESLGEHDEKTHAIFVYDATLHVPLIVRYPKYFPQGEAYADPVRHVDLVPTILSLLGLPGGEQTQGVDLMPAIRGDKRMPDLAQYSESLLSEVGFGMAPLYSLRKDGHQWIRVPKPELYDLVRDPQELRNLYPDPDRLYATLDAELERVFEDSRRRGLAARDNPMSRETMEMLQSLGYLQGASDRQSMGGMDPKDGIAIYNRLEDARHLAQNEKWPEAEKKLRALVDDYPHHVSARSVLALTLLRQGRIDEAKAEYQRVLADDGDKARGYLMLGIIAMLQNKLGDAERYFNDALAASPAFVEAASNLGLVAKLRGDDAGARRWYERAIAIDPTYPHGYRRIADVLYDRKEFAEARVYYDRTLERVPKDFHALVQAGNSARYSGHPDDARAYYAKAEAVRPESWLPTYNLACLDLAQGRTDAAFTGIKSAFDKGLPPTVPAQDVDWKAWHGKPAFRTLLARADAHRVREDD